MHENRVQSKNIWKALWIPTKCCSKVYIILTYTCYRFGYCGEDAGYCYPVQGCVLRGVDIEGGDLSPAEGGGGVLVERGQLDGCAFACEENNLCGWYTYDKRSNKCYLKGTRGYLNNGTQTATIISGSTQSAGCVFTQREKAFRGTSRGQPETPRQGVAFNYDNYYDNDYNNLDYGYGTYSDYSAYDYIYSAARPRAGGRGVVGVRNGGRVVGGARRQKTVTNPYLGLLG